MSGHNHRRSWSELVKDTKRGRRFLGCQGPGSLASVRYAKRVARATSRRKRLNPPAQGRVDEVVEAKLESKPDQHSHCLRK
jgi:hypothetical protein